MTHRGPLLPAYLVKNAALLFGDTMVIPNEQDLYSLGWNGQFPGESIFQLLFDACTENIGVKDLMANMNTLDGGYRGVPVNLLMADNSGDIGYMLLLP